MIANNTLAVNDTSEMLDSISSASTVFQEKITTMILANSTLPMSSNLPRKDAIHSVMSILSSGNSSNATGSFRNASNTNSTVAPLEAEHCVSWAVSILGIAMLSIISLAGSLGNIVTIVAVIKYHKLRRMCNIYIVNLAIVDFIVSAFLTPISIHTMVTHREPVGCDTILPFISMTCTAVSILNFSAIAVNRYISIIKSQNVYNRYFTAWRSVVSVVVIWLIGAAVSLPPLVGFGNYGYDHKFGICFVAGTNPENYWYILGISTVFTAPFLLTTGFSYMQIMRKFNSIQKRQRQHSSKNCALPIVTGMAKTSVEDSCGNIIPYSPDPKRPNTDKKHGKQDRRQMDMFRVAFNCVVIWIFYLVVWTPVLGLHVADYHHAVHPNFYRILFVVAYTNFAVNAFIYAALNRNFRQAFKETLLCRLLVKNSADLSSSDNNIV